MGIEIGTIRPSSTILLDEREDVGRSSNLDGEPDEIRRALGFQPRERDRSPSPFYDSDIFPTSLPNGLIGRDRSLRRTVNDNS